jgi:hypothetical protein
MATTIIDLGFLNALVKLGIAMTNMPRKHYLGGSVLNVYTRSSQVLQCLSRE